MSTTTLKREIGLTGAVMLVIGGIVGAGIFMNPATVAKTLHSPVLMLGAWAVGGLIALLGSFVYAELAERMPETGGEYAYLRDVYGPIWGFLYGWTTLLVVQTGGMAAVAITFANYFQVLMGVQGGDKLLVGAVLAVLAGANCLGVKSGNWVQTLLGALKVIAITALVISGLVLVSDPKPLTHPVLDRPMSFGLVEAFGGALIPVLFAFGGWQTANFVAGEIKNPRKNLARALLIGVGGVVLLYLAVNIACLRALGPAKLAATTAPAADVLRVAVGPLGAKLAAAAISLSALGYLSQSMLTAPRVYYAMARDGLFFRQLALVSEGRQVPVAAIVLQAVWTAVLALSNSYEKILSYVVAMNFLFFGISASCIFVLRRREKAAGGPKGEVGFRAPLHPFTTGLFILACAVVVVASFVHDWLSSLIGYAIMAVGVGPYLYWRGKNPGAGDKTPKEAAS
ncbi:MAG: amino acid permease [Proteobacteria bacterium]|nr:amino acid permease [Pseudomonadota bacterium]